MIRTTRPVAGNKYFIRQANGGYSTCIQGSPTDSQCNVLSNCVGYACGAFNEELGLGYEKYHLNCNAENFIERAIASGLSVVSKPVVGSILCWAGAGSLAGHVAIVVEVINDNCIKTAESGYGSSNPFWITTRYNNNGRWGLNSNYTPRGFIVNPNYPYNPPAPTPKKSNEEIAREVIAGKWGNYPERKTRLEAAGYDYATIQGIVNEMLKPSPAPTPRPLSVGDTVKIVGTGNGASDGSANTAYGIGWTRQILKIYEGRKFPYQVGNSTGTTGFYKADALQRI